MTTQYIVTVFFQAGNVAKHNKLLMTDTSDVNVMRQCADWLETQYSDLVKVISITVSRDDELIVA